MENKKKNISKIIIIIIVSLLVGVGGFFAGMKLAKVDLHITKINATSEEKESTSGPIEVNSKLAKYLYSMLPTDNFTLTPWMYPDKNKILTSDLTEEQKMGIVLNNIPIGKFSSIYTENSSLNKNIQDNRNWSYALAYNEVDGFVPKDIVESTYERIFGEKTWYTPDTTMYGFQYWTAYIYGKDETNQEGYFKYKCTACGGGSAYTVTRTLEKAEYYNGDVRLYEKSIATDPDGGQIEQNVIYTFKRDKKDNLYYFYSREVQ